MQFSPRVLREIADMICGNYEGDEASVFRYRSSSYLTEFFADVGTNHAHDGSTRSWWVTEVLKEILTEPSSVPNSPPDTFLRVISMLMDVADAQNESSENRPKALEKLNDALRRDNFEAFYGEDGICYLRHTGSNQILTPQANPHRPFTKEERERHECLSAFLEDCSEDQLIEKVLSPLFRQLGFAQISVTGHKDKALEYGIDLWMRYVLPTQHPLYFGLQVKKGKIDSAGRSRSDNTNVAEILNQVNMILGAEIFDSEVSRRVLVDHAFIISGGEITKSAKNLLGSRLDASKRSQVMFMDRDDILNLYVVTNLPIPSQGQQTQSTLPDDIPF